MNSATLISLKLSFLLVVAVQGQSDCPDGNCLLANEDYDTIPDPEDADRVKQECLEKLDNTEKYAFLANVYYKCGRDSGDVTGVILSDNRVLFVTSTIIKNVGQCTYEVLAGTDQYAKGGTKHVAESVKIGDKGELTLLKLKTPIKFGSRAKSIPLVSKKPKEGNSANFTSWVFNQKEKKYEGIYATNVTLLDGTECKRAISWSPINVRRFNDYGTSFCIHHFKSPCPVSIHSVLIVDGQLFGLINEAYDTKPEANLIVYSFYDVAHYNAAIKNHI